MDDGDVVVKGQSGAGDHAGRSGRRGEERASANECLGTRIRGVTVLVVRQGVDGVHAVQADTEDAQPLAKAVKGAEGLGPLGEIEGFVPFALKQLVGDVEKLAELVRVLER